MTPTAILKQASRDAKTTLEKHWNHDEDGNFELPVNIPAIIDSMCICDIPATLPPYEQAYKLGRKLCDIHHNNLDLLGQEKFAHTFALETLIPRQELECIASITDDLDEIAQTFNVQKHFLMQKKYLDIVVK